METLQQQKTPQKASFDNRSSVSDAAIAYLSRTIVHAKLEMTEPGDHDEQEADAAANDIVNGGKIRRKISGNGGSGTAVSPQVESQIAQLQGGGHAMPAGLRHMMENGFGRDFSQVRLHTDSQAADMSSSISARAFTHGNDIYFNRGQFSPNTSEGQRLMAHELTHVAQGTGKVGREYDGTIPMDIILNNQRSFCKNDEACKEDFTSCSADRGTIHDHITDIDRYTCEIVKIIYDSVHFNEIEASSVLNCVLGIVGGVATIVSAVPQAAVVAIPIAGVASIVSALYNKSIDSQNERIKQKNGESANLLESITSESHSLFGKILQQIDESNCESGRLFISEDMTIKLNQYRKFLEKDRFIIADKISNNIKSERYIMSRPYHHAYYYYYYVGYNEFYEYDEGLYLADIDGKTIYASLNIDDTYNNLGQVSLPQQVNVFPQEFNTSSSNLKDYYNTGIVKKRLADKIGITKLTSVKRCDEEIDFGNSDNVEQSIYTYLVDRVTPHNDKSNDSAFTLVEKSSTIKPQTVKNLCRCFYKSKHRNRVIINEDKLNNMYNTLTSGQRVLVKKAIKKLDTDSVGWDKFVSWLHNDYVPIDPTNSIFYDPLGFGS